ncbi:TPA: ABC transporter substrate-binding protein [Raoultella planticola]
MSKYNISRRALLRSAGIIGVGLGIGGATGIFRPPAAVAGTTSPAKLTTVKLAWYQTDVCQAPISIALKRGLFEKYGLNVEPVNFSGSADTLLQSIATGHADGGIGMALRWLKPLEQGFDVKLVVGTHGGCMRLLAGRDSGIAALKDLVGKSVAVSDPASPVRHFFAIQLAKLGIDPDTQVNWVQYPDDLSAEALQKGEVQAIATGDPEAWLIKKNNHLTEIYNNLSGDYADVACCVLGLRGSLIRNQPEIANALTQAIVEAQQWTADHPAESAEIFAPYVPGSIAVKDVEAMLREHTHAHHSTGARLRREIALNVNDLKRIHVIRSDVDAARFAEQYVADFAETSRHQHA